MLAAVMMVKDERDVIEATIRHAVAEGVELLLILDNLSTDGTSVIIEDLASELHADCTIRRTVDREIAYYQSRKVSVAARAAARKHRADWILPLDADELWCAPAGTLADWLSTHDAATNVLTADLVTHYSTDLDDPTETNPVARLTWRTTTIAPLPKVMFRAAPGATIAQGAHRVTLGGGRNSEGLGGTGLMVRHYPYRSLTQFARKVENGARAYAAARTLHPGMGDHWRGYGAILANEGLDGLRAVYEQHFHFPDPVASGLIQDPAPRY